MPDPSPAFGRRSLLRGAIGVAAAAALPLARPALAAAPMALRAAPGRQAIAGAGWPETAVWCFNGRVPGTEVRLRQGQRLRVRAENGLAEGTTVHFHGVRMPNAMDGVPHLTQPPIAPGADFLYDFTVPDAGTFWYHPHQRSSEQVGRGLYGAVVVEEAEPPDVDRDLLWVLDDWRLQRDGAIAGDFGNLMDISHAGRLGNTVTINGTDPEPLKVRPGERLRLRLVNAANARIFGLTFAGELPWLIANDGQPCQPDQLPGGRLVLAPGGRADLIIDVSGRDGDRLAVTDDFYRNQSYRLTELVCEGPTRVARLSEPRALPPNPLPEPDLAKAPTHEIVLGGGMMGGMAGGTVMGGPMNGRRLDLREMMHNGLAWTVNGVAATGHVLDPLLTLDRGASYRLVLRNDTAWWHPMHLHGHSFRVVARDGAPEEPAEWRDTVLLYPQETVQIAFVADNPGDWMFHCHILEHQQGGMSAVVRVA